MYFASFYVFKKLIIIKTLRSFISKKMQKTEKCQMNKNKPLNRDFYGYVIKLEKILNKESHKVIHYLQDC